MPSTPPPPRSAGSHSGTPSAAPADQREPAPAGIGGRGEVGGIGTLVLAIEISNLPAQPAQARSVRESDAPSRAGVALARIAPVPAGPDARSVPPSGEAVRVLAVERWADADRSSGAFSGDDWLMPAIDRAFAAAQRAEPGLRLTEIGRVAVSAGPGGYTSVRVACATGKMIAEAVNARGGACGCVRVWSHFGPAWYRAKALAIAGGRQSAGSAGLLAVALAGKGESAWISAPLPRDAAVWDGSTVRAAARGGVMVASDLAGLRSSGVVELLTDAYLPESMRKAAAAAGIRTGADDPALRPAFDPTDVAEASRWLEVVDGAELNPIYPREPDAVTLWRAKKERERA